MRADAVRNREQILRAVVEMIFEFGHVVPMEVIARQAGVGAATLYRHFPDRTNLYTEVQLDLLTRSADEAEAALREEQDAFAALARYMHEAVDLRACAVMSLLRDQVQEDERIDAARVRAVAAIGGVVARAHRERALRPEVTAEDIGLLITRVSQPIPGLSTAENIKLSHRHLELLLDGFIHFLAVDMSPGPAVSDDGPDRP